MYVVDTNILVYAANHDDPVSPACRDFLESTRESTAAWYVTWGILYEFLRVVTHRRFLPRPWADEGAWHFVESLLASPGLSVLRATNRHATVARDVFALGLHLRGDLFHDAHTAILMREHGIKTIYTRDTDFHRFPFLEVVDPTLRG